MQRTGYFPSIGMLLASKSNVAQPISPHRVDAPMAESLQIDDDLFERAARCAHQEGTNVHAVVEDLLREYVNESDDASNVQRVWARMDRSLHDADPGLDALDDFDAAA